MFKLNIDGCNGVVDGRLVVDSKIHFPCFGKITELDGDIEFDIIHDPGIVSWLVETKLQESIVMDALKVFGEVRKLSDTTYIVEVLTADLGVRYSGGKLILPLPGVNFQSSDVYRDLGFRVVKWKKIE